MHKSCLFPTALLWSLLITPSVGQLNLAEAEKISAQTGRTMFVVAGQKT